MSEITTEASETETETESETSADVAERVTTCPERAPFVRVAEGRPAHRVVAVETNVTELRMGGTATRVTAVTACGERVSLSDAHEATAYLSDPCDETAGLRAQFGRTWWTSDELLTTRCKRCLGVTGETARHRGVTVLGRVIGASLRDGYEAAVCLAPERVTFYAEAAEAVEEALTETTEVSVEVEEVRA